MYVQREGARDQARKGELAAATRQRVTGGARRVFSAWVRRMPYLRHGSLDTQVSRPAGKRAAGGSVGPTYRCGCAGAYAALRLADGTLDKRPDGTLDTRARVGVGAVAACVALLRTRAGGARLSRALLVMFAFAWLWTANVAWAQESGGEVVSTWGGAVNCVYIQQDADPWTAYVGSGRRLVILNVQDPANIREIGSIDLGNEVQDVKVRDGYAYVTTYFRPYPFSVIDVSTPSAPRMVWHLPSTDFFIGQKVELRGNVAYVQEEDCRLYAFDITDPEHPESHGTVFRDEVTYAAHAFAIAGNLMYVASGWAHPGRFHVFDLSADPYTPALVGSIELPWPPSWSYWFSMAVEGEHVYLASYETMEDSPLAVIDVSDPAAPAVVGVYHFLEYALPCLGAVSDGLAYVANWRSLAILDVATCPASPSLVGTVATHGRITDVAVFGERAYVMDEGEGLIIYQLGAGMPARIGGWHSPADLRKIDKVGDLLYVTDKWNGISILDVSDARRPALVGTYQTGEVTGYWGKNSGIDVVDGKAYLSAGYSGVEVVDVSDPAHPDRLVGLPFSGRTYSLGMTVDAGVAYVGVGDGGYMLMLDVSDPTALQEITSIGTHGPASKIDVRDDVATTVSFAYLTTINVEEPERPQELSHCLLGDATDFVRVGDWVYWTNDGLDSSGLHVVNISDPSQPVPVSYFPTDGADAVTAVGNRVYVLAAYEGHRQLLTFDVTDPTAPALQAGVPVPGAKCALFVAGRYAYVTGSDTENGQTGLAIIEMPVVRGDVNCDGAVDVFDIDPFVVALASERAEYAAAYPGCDATAADCNGDGVVNTFDIDPFVGLLVSGR